MSKQKIHNIKLELLRRQNTFSQMAMSDSFTYMPVTSTCKVIAQSSLANFDWWKAVDEGMRSQVTIAIEVPSKITDPSYSTECVFETPITLFHQISIDPPPNIYVHKINPVEGIEANLFLQKAQEQRHQRASVLSSSYETFSSDSMETSTESLGKSISDKKNSLTKALRGILQSHRPNSQKSPLAATSLPALLSPTSSTVEYVQMNEVEARKTVGPPESIDASVAGFRQQLGMHMAEEAMQGYIAEVCSTTETEGSLSSTESTTFHDLYQQNSASSSEWHRKENPRALKRMMASSSRYMRSFRSKSMYFQQLNALDTEKGQKC
ncbi:hypothetical protein BDF14DRAFT_1741146 [Spinellus fusiger]|nr:hypothetical protein BDF14DRAFT_1741146 [Spinellus fusiger]